MKSQGFFFFCYCVLLLCVPFGLPGLEGWGTLSRLMEVASHPSCGSLLPTAWWGPGGGSGCLSTGFTVSMGPLVPAMEWEEQRGGLWLRRAEAELFFMPTLQFHLRCRAVINLCLVLC